MPVTLQELARRTGLSVSTVSRVLRGKENVSAEAAEAVQSALRLLGLAGAHAGGAPMIAVVVPRVRYFDLDAWKPLRRELFLHLFEAGFVGVTVTAEEDPDPERFRDFDLLGALVLGEEGKTAGAALEAAGVPVLRIAVRPPAGPGSILLDFDAGIDTAVRHLSQLGHRRIGMAVALGPDAGPRAAAFRRSAARRLHIEATRAQAPVEQAGPGVPAGRQAADGLLAAGCTAIVSCGPALTLGAMQSAQLAGLSMPEQLSLLAIGEVPEPEVLSPAVSQVTFDWTEVATQAIDALTTLAGRDASGPVSGGAARRGPQPLLQVAPDLLLRSSAAPIRQR